MQVHGDLGLSATRFALMWPLRFLVKNCASKNLTEKEDIRGGLVSLHGGQKCLSAIENITIPD